MVADMTARCWSDRYVRELLIGAVSCYLAESVSFRAGMKRSSGETMLNHVERR